MNSDLKKVIDRVKKAQTQIQTLVKDKKWVSSAKKYAERQGKEVKKIINSDVSKIKAFLNREKKELTKLQKSIPGEVDKIKAFVEEQRKDLQSLLNTVKKDAETKGNKVVGQVTKAAKKKIAEVRKSTAKVASQVTGGKKISTRSKKKTSAKTAAAPKTTKKSPAKSTPKKSTVRSGKAKVT